MKKLHIFKSGSFVAMSGQKYEFTEADLKASARAYDPALHEAPMVIGHPKDDAPAYGWINSLGFEEGAGLFAEPTQVDPGFAELHQAGRYKKRSASFYAPDDPRNPKPGVYYLKHVGFLGANPPAVKGLKAANFADSDNLITIEFGEEAGWGLRNVADLLRGVREFVIEKFGTEEADRVLPTYQIDSVADNARRELEKQTQPTEPAFTETQTEEHDMTAEELAKQKKQFEADQAAFAEQQQEFEQKQKQQAADAVQRRKDDALAFCEGLVKQGILLPAHKQTVAGVLGSIQEADTVEFGEGDDKTTKSLGGAFKEFLGGLPKKIEFGEVAGADLGEAPAAEAGKQPVDFSEDLTSRC